MYFPLLRGKQYELVLLREQADLIGDNDFWPIIEPVRPNLSPIERASTALREKDCTFSILIRPSVGEAPERTQLLNWLADTYADYPNFSVGVMVDQKTSAEELDSVKQFHNVLFLHLAQPSDEIFGQIQSWQGDITHVFNEDQCGKLYRRKFPRNAYRRILLRDGYAPRDRNADYPETEHFSDLHATYEEEGMDGFSDYLIVGRRYHESGGPAHAIAIHLTYLDADNDMHICHFLSERTESPVDPGGKFLEALTRLRDAYNRQQYPILGSKAVEEFLDLYERRHFPGLGYVKKLSMQHHLELIVDYFS